MLLIGFYFYIVFLLIFGFGHVRQLATSHCSFNSVRYRMNSNDCCIVARRE